MKQLLSLFTLLTISIFSVAQTVTSVPEFPTADEPLIIYFDATGTGLEGYTGDVYAHTGVNLENGSDWQHVIGSWGNNTTQPQLTLISTDYYSLEIATSVNDFYSVGDGEVVDQIAVVFRSEDGSAQSADLTLDIYNQTNTITIASPLIDDIFSIGDSVEIQAVAMFADSVKLFLADTLYFETDSTILSKKVPALVEGNTYFTVIAKNDTEADTVETSFFVRQNNVVADLPSGLEYGINYIDNNTVTLVLFAPNKDYIFVKGDFNDWGLSLDYQMNITPNDSIYWLTITGLTSGEEYAFQYFVDGEFSVADPYTDKVLDPWNDEYIDDATYPNLKQYPEKGDGIVSVFQTAQTPFDWQITDFNRPENEDLIIYELHIRDFIAAHNYQTMIDTINYLKDLDINAIELMPINEFEGNSSWGYNPSFYFAPDKYYGTKDKLKEFIDVCHQNGLAVILDMVYNHSYGQSPLVLLYLDRTTWKVTPDNPWYNVESPNSSYSWGYDFNHESKATVDFIDRNITYWLTDYKVDGFRFDFTKGFTNTVGDGWAYDQSRIDILKHYYDVTQTASDNSYLILEHLTDNSEETILANYGMMLWGNENYNYAQASMGWPNDTDFSWISYKNRGWTNPHVVGYMESHDEERMMFRNITYGNSEGDYDVTDEETALKRVELAAIFFITVPGPKMLWQFEELGYDISIEDPCRVCEKPILWNYFDEPDRNKLYEFFATLINLRKELPVFKTSDFTMNTSGMVKQIILKGDTMDIVIVGNFDVKSKSVTPNYTQSGTWYEYFTNSQTTGGSITLAPGEYRMYSTSQIASSELPSAPQISAINISGDAIINSKLSGNYTFYDLNNDLEANSTYQWYTSDYADGRNKKEISGATDTTYVINKDDYEKYIGFEVTPIAESEELSVGKSKISKFIGAVNYNTEELTVFPNPFTDIVNILNTSDYDDIYISDAAGNFILHKEIYGRNLMSFDFTTLEEGIYFVKIIGAKEQIELKMVKIKL